MLTRVGLVWGKYVRLLTMAFTAFAIVLLMALPSVAQELYPPDTGVLAEGEERVAFEDAIAQPAGDGGELAFTGSSATVGTALAAGLLVGGSGVLLIARRRGRASR